MRPGDPLAVENLFNDVAARYDLLNDLLSLGLHRVWKRQVLVWLAPNPGENWLDLCCGTGDMALALARRLRPGGFVFGIDSALEPLNVALKRAKREPWLSLSFIQKDVLQTGLPANSFDGAVMAYGLRNLSNPSEGLKELHRLLKPGARAGLLDFNQLGNNSLQARFQKFYLRKVVVPIAKKFGFRDHYAYLEESLKSFPSANKQIDLALRIGFKEAKYRCLAGGQMGALLLEV